MKNEQKLVPAELIQPISYTCHCDRTVTEMRHMCRYSCIAIPVKGVSIYKKKNIYDT